MLVFLNSLTADAYAGIAAFVAAVGTALAAVRWGLHRTPPAHATAPDAAPLVILQEVQEIKHRLEDIKDRLGVMDDRLDAARMDISVIRDRSNRTVWREPVDPHHEETS